MEDKQESVEAPDVFLAQLGESLRKKEGIDDGLAEILEKHILTARPENDAVTSATKAIVELAGERAALSKPEVPDG